MIKYHVLQLRKLKVKMQSHKNLFNKFKKKIFNLKNSTNNFL